MTDYIEQMMKTTGCKTHPRGCTNDDINGYTDYISNDCEGDCEDCAWYDPYEYYPDFTAEKQLELIKLIGLGDYNISIYKKVEGTISIAVEPNTYKYSYSSLAQDFSQALAQLTTELMNAGELDKEKVKEILEC